MSTSAALMPAFALVALACSRRTPVFCSSTSTCPAGMTCDLVMHACVMSDGGVDRTGASDASDGSDGPDDVPPPCTASSCSGTTPVCENATKMCRACASGTECMALDPMKPACASSGTCVGCAERTDCMAPMPACDTATNACVECLGNGDCAAATKPICNTSAQTCRACAVDSECPADPGVCMADGHCAMSGEVIFVEFNAAGCPNPDGSRAKPYCAPNDAVAQLTTARHVIVIVGAVNAQMTLATAGKAPVIVGRRSSSGIDGSILAGAATAVTVTSDTVLIRDLTVNLGSTATSKGILASGTGTQVTLLRVTASLGNVAPAAGLGIDAENGATLAMDHCAVTNNSAGGILVDGAAFDIANTTVTGNGTGTDRTGTTWGGIRVISLSTAGPSSLRFLTVASNNNTGISCSASAPVSGTNVSASANVGGVDITTSTCGFSSCGIPGPTCGVQP